MAYSIIETASIKFQNRVNLNNSSPLCLFHVKWNHFHVSVNILNMGSNKKQLHLLYTIKYFLTIFFQIFHFHSYHKRKFRLDITQTKRSKYQNAKWRLINQFCPNKCWNSWRIFLLICCNMMLDHFKDRPCLKLDVGWTLKKINWRLCSL